MNRLANHHVVDVHINVVRDVDRIHFDFEVAQSLVEYAAIDANACRNPHEHDRDANSHLLARDELLEIHMQDLPAERVALDFADQRPGRLAVHDEFHDGVFGRDVFQQPVQLVVVERQRLRCARMAVDDARDAACTAHGSGGAFAGRGPRGRGELC